MRRFSNMFCALTKADIIISLSHEKKSVLPHTHYSDVHMCMCTIYLYMHILTKAHPLT